MSTPSHSTTSPQSAPVPPEIESSDLDAVRQFLAGSREGERRHNAHQVLGGPVLRHGIARARMRSRPAAKGD